MKNLRLLKRLLFTIVALSLSTTASFAHDFEVDWIYYNILSESDKTVEVTCRGEWYDSYTNEYSGSVTIPETVTYSGKTYSVTSIGDDAFCGCSGLTSVTIPNSVTSIGEYAFDYCTGLTSVTIPNSVTAIGYGAFEDCSGLKSVTIGNSVTSIGNYAFDGCSGLTSVTIPNSVTSIGKYAFLGCSGLTSIRVESGNSNYDSRDNCNAIIETETNTLIVGCQNTMIPNSVTSIGDDAFSRCYDLTSVTIPNSVTSIGKYAFAYCSGLTSVTIGNSVTSIGVGAFYGCNDLTSVTIPNSVTSIGDEAFSRCNDLTSVTIPNSVTSIGDDAFRGCSGLTEVTIGNSVTSIGEYAFYECSGLTEVTIGNSVTEIGRYAFYGCKNLNQVINLSKLSLTKGSDNHGYVAYYASIIINVPNGIINGDFVWSISEEDDVNILVRYLGAASELILPDDYNGENYVIGNDAFYNCKNLRSVTIGNSVTSIGDSAFENCKNLRSVTIGNSVTSIGDSAFYNCSGLTEVTIGNSVTSIGDWAFSGCKKITKLVIADGTETLPLGNSFTDCPFVKLYLGRDYSYNTTDSPFSNKKTLKEITIGNSITSIREKEFLNCIGLTSLTIGTGVLSIGTNAFSYYDNNNYSNLDIKKVIWLTNTPPQGYETVAGEVNYVANNRYSDLSNVTIYPYLSSLFEVDGIKYVPVSPSERTCDALECSYETTISNINIGKTVSFKGIEMNIKAVKPYTFYDNTNITKATIDSEFKGSIGDYAFAYCNKIDEIILPDGVTSLGGSAFEGCSSLASVEIGSGIPALNDNAFYGCTPLSKITIPANVTSIGNNVFGNCSSLEELTITDRDTELSLGSNGSNPLFSDCPLKSVYIGGNISYPTSSDYGYSPFYRNISLETVVITDKETEISENEFYGCTALKTVYMGDGVKTIGDWAFSGCSSLDSFSFGTGMKTIGTEAFSDCTAMTKLYSNAIVPPTCGSQALDDINKWNCELYVPQASITKYQIADQWKEFFFIKDIESGIEDVYVEEVAVTVEDGKIVVKNVTGIVTIYNLNGIAVASETADGNEVRFDNLQPGVYIVVVNNKSVKVVL